MYIYIKDGLYHEEIENWIKFVNNYENYNTYDAGIKEAKEKLSKLRYDEETLTVIKSIEEKEMDNEAEKYNSHQKGLEEGKIEGLKEGKKEKSIEIAKNMLKLGYKIEDIAEISGLSVEEITLLKK